MMGKLFLFFTADVMNSGNFQFVCQLFDELHVLLHLNVLFLWGENRLLVNVMLDSFGPFNMFDIRRIDTFHRT